MSALAQLAWAAFCLLVTAFLLYVVIRVALRRSRPPDDPDYSSSV